MNSYYTDLFDLKEYGIERFPQSQYSGWAHEQLYIWGQDNKVAEYSPSPVDDTLDIWPGPDSEWMNDDIKNAIFDKSLIKMTQNTYPFQVKIGDCVKQDNGFYGKNASSTECYLFACDKKY